jgi:ABC-type branched-subunit amino acid transport system substrate-binding protein
VARSDGSRSSVARALLATNLRDAPLGPIRFTPRGDLRGAPVAVLRARRAPASDAAPDSVGAAVIAVH